MFDVLIDFPWKLAVGNVEQNMQELEASDAVISDTLASSLRASLRVGYNRHLVVGAVAL